MILLDTIEAVKATPAIAKFNFSVHNEWQGGSQNCSTADTFEGQAFQFVDAPNRFGIPSFFELHVWAWRDNPNGAFVDWNNSVSCEGQ